MRYKVRLENGHRKTIAEGEIEAPSMTQAVEQFAAANLPNARVMGCPIHSTLARGVSYGVRYIDRRVRDATAYVFELK